MWQLIFKILLLVWASLANAHGVDVRGDLPVSLSGQIRLYEDTAHAQDLAAMQAWALEAPDSFHDTVLERHQALAPSSAWWLSFAVVNTQPTPMTLRFLPGTLELDRLDYYVGTAEGWTHTASGRLVPVSEQSPDTAREQALLIELPAQGERRILMRIQNSKKFTLHPTLYPQPQYFLAEEHENLLVGMLFGGLLSIAWCCLLVALHMHSLALGLLSLLGAAMTLYEASLRGYAKLYLWPEATEWAARAPHVFGHAALALFLLFLLSMAKEGRHHPLVGKVVMVLAGIQATLAAAALCVDLALLDGIVAQIALLYAIGLPIAALVLLRRSVRSFRLLIVMSAFFFSHTLLRALERGGLFAEPLRSVGLDNPGTHPVIALAGLAFSLPLLTIWVIEAGRRAEPARAPLAPPPGPPPAPPQAQPDGQTAALNRALHEADEKNRRQSEMLSYIGHDLRAPLATIAGYVRLLKHTETSEQAPHMQAIERSVNYQLVLIDELLECAKTELLPLTIQPTEVSVTAFLDEIASYAEALSTQQNNVFKAGAASPLPSRLLMDGHRLKQVLLNLLSNAAKFTRDGTIELKVEASITGKRCALEFSVSDSGIGIAPQSQAAIFMPFSQVRATPGSVGLGLHIARSLIENMGGSLSVASTPGKGSRFHFRISADIVDGRPTHWRRADAQPSGAAAAPAPSGMPDGHLRQLAALAQAGELSRIEEWLGLAARSHPQAAGFLAEVRGALLRMDFKRIEALAQASAPHQ